VTVACPPPLRGGTVIRRASYPRVALRSTRGYAPAPLRGGSTPPPRSLRFSCACTFSCPPLLETKSPSGHVRPRSFTHPLCSVTRNVAGYAVPAGYPNRARQEAADGRPDRTLPHGRGSVSGGLTRFPQAIRTAPVRKRPTAARIGHSLTVAVRFGGAWRSDTPSRSRFGLGQPGEKSRRFAAKRKRVKESKQKGCLSAPSLQQHQPAQ